MKFNSKRLCRKVAANEVWAFVSRSGRLARPLGLYSNNSDR